jgi:hypothetical protein
MKAPARKLERVITWTVFVAFVAVWVGYLMRLTPREEPDQLVKLAKEHGIDHYGMNGSSLYDLVQDTDAYKACVKEVDAATKEEFERQGYHGMGSYLTAERIKKRILAEKYHIEWRSYSEMNPWRILD